MVRSVISPQIAVCRLITATVESYLQVKGSGENGLSVENMQLEDGPNALYQRHRRKE